MGAPGKAELNMADWLETAHIQTGAVTTQKIADANVTIAKLESALQKGVITIPVSFEAGEQGAYRVYFPFKVTINKIRGIVTRAIAGTDNGTIQGANATGNSAGGAITATAGDAIGTEYTATPTSNNVVAADSYYQLTTAKTTTGGKVLCTLEYTRTP